MQDSGPPGPGLRITDLNNTAFHLETIYNTNTTRIFMLVCFLAKTKVLTCLCEGDPTYYDDKFSVFGIFMIKHKRRKGIIPTPPQVLELNHFLCARFKI